MISVAQSGEIKSEKLVESKNVLPRTISHFLFDPADSGGEVAPAAAANPPAESGPWRGRPVIGPTVMLALLA